MSESDKHCFVIGPIGDEGSPERGHADWLLDDIILPVLKKFFPEGPPAKKAPRAAYANFPPPQHAWHGGRLRHQNPARSRVEQRAPSTRGAAGAGAAPR